MKSILRIVLITGVMLISNFINSQEVSSDKKIEIQNEVISKVINETVEKKKCKSGCKKACCVKKDAIKSK